MKTLEIAIQVHAPPERVWSILTDLDGYSSWNPYIIRAHGQMDTGNRLEVQKAIPGSEAQTVHPVITGVIPGKQIRWVEKARIPGIFTEEYTFAVHHNGNSYSALLTRGTFHGIMVPLVWGSLARSTRASMLRMNEALKERAEEELE